MITLKKSIFILIPLVICFSLITYFSHADNKGASQKQVFLIVNNKVLGDTNQIRGVARYFALDKNTKIEEYSFEETEKLINQIATLAPTTQTIVISSGAWGIPAIKNVAARCPDAKTVYLSHQLFEDHNQLLKNETNQSGVCLVVLPTHAVNSEWLNKTKKSATELLLTTGVCHNVTVDELEKEYEKYKALIPQADSYCVVILGGDAEQPDKSWLYYTPQDATKLAEHIHKNLLEKNQYLIVLNGPRTGKHYPQSGELDQNAHKNNNLDAATQSFVNYFKTVGFEKVVLFDFQFGQPSMYKPVLGALLHCQQGDIYVPGESISMGSEVIDMVGSSNHRVILYEHSAMNITHEKYVESEYQAGRALVMTRDGEIKQTRENRTVAESAAEATAKKILSLAHSN